MTQPISSETIGLISEALAKAQGSIQNAVKDSNNPFFKSKYADLASVTEVCKEPLSKNCLSFSSSVVHQDGKATLIGTISHVSGEWFRTYIPLILEKMDMQKLGAAITYARRFAMMSLCNVSTDDDDGESIVNRSPKAESTQKHDMISEDQSKWLKDLMNQIKDKKFLEDKAYKMKVPSLLVIDKSHFNSIKDCLNRKIEEEKNV